MAAFGLRAHADDLHIVARQVLGPVPERTGLSGADGREVGRVEVEQHRASLEQFREIDSLACLIRTGKGGGPGSFFEHERV